MFTKSPEEEMSKGNVRVGNVGAGNVQGNVRAGNVPRECPGWECLGGMSERGIIQGNDREKQCPRGMSREMSGLGMFRGNVPEGNYTGE